MKVGIEITADSGPGILHELTGVIARHSGNILSVEIIDERIREESNVERVREESNVERVSEEPNVERVREESNVERVSGVSSIEHVREVARRRRGTRTVFEIDLPGEAGPLVVALGQLPVVHHAAQVETMETVYGKRIIIMGGGAQVGQVALGAITEADRHNIRGEHISVDTIPLVGEASLAAAVRASARLPRVKAIVLAGSLMGGAIEQAVREVRAAGLLVVSLNMAGSVPDAADLVVTDPVQAGVMTVMAVADTAKFTVERLKRRVF
jgi:energy-converting hydrogenase B subunit Q